MMGEMDFALHPRGTIAIFAIALALLASLIKFEHFEWLIEKATELGVEQVIPVEAERSEKGLAAAAQKFGMFLCVQDLTCPGASLIHSAGLAAHVPGVAAIEANARQYMPAANNLTGLRRANGRR